MASLSGCGFRPVYGVQNNKQVERHLAYVQIEPVEDRLGQMFHNELLTLMNPKGKPVDAVYRLKVTLTGSTAGLAVAKTKLATRSNYQLSGSYTLYNKQTGETLFSDSFAVTSSYNTLESEFGTLMAEKDAKRRVAIEGAREVATQLSVFFTQRLNAR